MLLADLAGLRLAAPGQPADVSLVLADTNPSRQDHARLDHARLDHAHAARLGVLQL